MKSRKGIVICAIAGFIASSLCLSGLAVGGGFSPNPPGVEENQKLIGPMFRGVLLAGWTHTDTVDGKNMGNVEAFLRIEDKLYAGIIACGVEDFDFRTTTRFQITTWPLPLEIAADFRYAGCEPVIFKEKDVDNLEVESGLNLVPGKDCPEGLMLYYDYILHCDVKISFICPKK
jgi:hypothetical protein